MSAANRLISSSVASWGQIGVTMISQMALVPLYLARWNVVTYGVWLAINALMNILSTLDFGHQEYLGYEFLRHGKDNRLEISRYLWSGIIVSILISITQIIFIVILITTNTLPSLLGKFKSLDSGLLHSASIVLLLNGFTWLTCVSLSGLLFRALTAFGYFPRMAWWGLFNSIVSSITPVVAVSLGADLLLTGIVSACTAIFLCIPYYIDSFRLLRKEQVLFVSPSLRLGFKNFLHSLAISGRSLLENVRQQGARLALAPLAGAAGLAAFSTMRTGANVALQGLNTVVNPLMPELMRFLHERDQARSEAAFGTVWFVLVAFMAPAIVILQAVIQPLFSIWTQGKVPFNPLLFATLSLSVLVYAAMQPAIAVVRGNNLLKAQLWLSALAALVAVGGIYFLVPQLGILGAGIALLGAEIAATVGYRITAQRWLHKAGLLWPKKPFRIALDSVWITTIAIGGIIWLPQMKWLLLIGSIILLVGNIWRYWQTLPTVATQQAKRILINLPGIKRITWLIPLLS